jgi:hypothetical protein
MALRRGTHKRRQLIQPSVVPTQEYRSAAFALRRGCRVSRPQGRRRCSFRQRRGRTGATGRAHQRRRRGWQASRPADGPVVARFPAHRPGLVSSCDIRAGQRRIGDFSNAYGLCDSLRQKQERRGSRSLGRRLLRIVLSGRRARLRRHASLRAEATQSPRIRAHRDPRSDVSERSDAVQADTRTAAPAPRRPFLVRPSAQADQRAHVTRPPRGACDARARPRSARRIPSTRG